MAVLKEMLKFQKDSALVKSIFYVDKKVLSIYNNISLIVTWYWLRMKLRQGSSFGSRQDQDQGI